jgi:catechol 2,3-dioxygenase-like lactoylglutathione lyase family enzyme
VQAPRVTEFRLILYVYHFEEVQHFYQDIIGLRIRHSWFNNAQDHGVMFDTGCGVIELLATEIFRDPVVDCKVALQVPNVVELHEQVVATGYPATLLTRQPWGDIDFTVVDPNGFPVIFFSSPPFAFAEPAQEDPGKWKRRSGKI